MQALAQHLGPTLYCAALVQALNTLHVKRLSKHKDLKLGAIKKSRKLGVRRRHVGLKEWKLPAVPFVVQLLSKFLYKMPGKPKLDCERKVPKQKNYKWDKLFQDVSKCFKQFVASDLFRKCLTRALQK